MYESKIRNEATDMLVKALCDFAGCEVPRVLVTRNRLLGHNESGELTPLELL